MHDEIKPNLPPPKHFTFPSVMKHELSSPPYSLEQGIGTIEGANVGV